ncbi:hypothetical protein [[Clostridium] fimetarium]|nr:hypothetical protein [[Clostridium] fimetarium]
MLRNASKARSKSESLKRMAYATQSVKSKESKAKNKGKDLKTW